ncbi:type VI secretion system-associated lipoprotein TagQ [Pseudomonas sp. GV071]|jgi:outer membrane lipoprotein SlyB|uniref:type VI secretion system-associated lipoprotein TagQ n=1 Tax=Pseudomonas sp. GV071 TaxID=2135754 RepID=UPI000D34E56F|nr:type VI secretion system-associated lipoprotein TagQ [Pseudomonas sp. GV071]PTQ73676.1 outer membrane protein with glycine zipper [Pseudomonas sp. GV071]
MTHHNHTHVLHTSARIAVSFLAASCIFISGCASTSPTSKVAATTTAQYYPSCYEPVSHLRGTEDSVKNSAMTGAIAGGLIGGLAGGLSGDDHAARNALIGAAGGALVGGAAGYYVEKQKQITDDNERIGSYATDIERSTGEMDRSVGYAKAAQACYQREFTNLRDARKAKKISEADGRAHLAEIVSGLKETNALLAAADGRTGEDLDAYTQAYEKDLQATGVQRDTVAQVATPDTTKKVTVTKAQRAKVTTQAVSTEKAAQKAQTSRTESQKVATQGKAIVSDVCNNPDMGDWAPESCAKA